MKMPTGLCGVALLLAACAIPARANLILFNAVLDGAQDNVVTTATGFGTVLLDDVADTITVNESWTGLTAPATASHIHGPAGPGVNAPVLFPFSGVPAATSGSIPQQTFSITLTQIGYLESGLLYFNVHDSVYPGGEIRGQIHFAPDAGPGVVGGLTLVALCALAYPRLRRREPGVGFRRR